MSRPRTPTAALESTGAFVKHPERKRARASEPHPTGELGDPPKHLRPDEKETWRELAALIPPGVAKNCDRWHVEETVCLMALSRRMRAVGQRLSSSDGNRLDGNLGKMGMNPADRSRVSATPKPPSAEDDPLAEFVQ